MAADLAPRWERVYVVALLAVTGGALAYALCDWSQWSRLHLDPYAGTWSWRAGPTASIPINYYGTILWGLAGAATGASVGVIVTRWWRRPLALALRRLGAAWALTAVLLAGTYYLWHLWPF